MKKSKFEEAIERKAKRRVREELGKLDNVIFGNDILKLLKIGEFSLSSIQYSNGKNIFLEHTNLEEVEEKLLEKYIEEETQNILKTVSDLEFLFGMDDYQ